MIAGVSVQLLVSALLYKILNVDDYTMYGLLLTLISIVASFGLMGSEQTFLRKAKVKGISVGIPRDILKLLVFFIIVGPLSLTIFFYEYWGWEFSSTYFIVLLTALVMLLHNVFRAGSRFFESQIINNLWRFSLLIPVLAASFYTIDIDDIFRAVTGGLLLACAVSIFYFDKKSLFIVRSEAGDVKSLTVAFFFSMGVLTCINFIDRMVVNEQFSNDEFSRYFFLINIFVSPFSILATYLGFKGLVYYKKHFSLAEIHRYSFLIMLVGSGVSLIVYYFSLMLDEVFMMELELDGSTSVIVPMLVLGVIRLVYSNLSAAMGAKGSSGLVFYTNILSLFSIISIIYSLYYYDVHTLSIVVWCMCVIWLVRSILYYFGLRFLYAKGSNNCEI
jgi:hypothetical protein